MPHFDSVIYVWLLTDDDIIVDVVAFSCVLEVLAGKNFYRGRLFGMAVMIW